MNMNVLYKLYCEMANKSREKAREAHPGASLIGNMWIPE